MSKEIALGKYQSPDASLEDRLDHAVRVGLAIVTEGVTIAPLQGISEIKIKNNKDGSQYLSVSTRTWEPHLFIVGFLTS